MLDIVVSYHRSSYQAITQFQGKPMFQTQENGKKTHFGPDFGPLGPNFSCQNVAIKLVTRHCSRITSYAI